MSRRGTAPQRCDQHQDIDDENHADERKDKSDKVDVAVTSQLAQRREIIQGRHDHQESITNEEDVLEIGSLQHESLSSTLVIDSTAAVRRDHPRRVTLIQSSPDVTSSRSKRVVVTVSESPDTENATDGRKSSRIRRLNAIDLTADDASHVDVVDEENASIRPCDISAVDVSEATRSSASRRQRHNSTDASAMHADSLYV